MSLIFRKETGEPLEAFYPDSYPVQPKSLDKLIEDALKFLCMCETLPSIPLSTVQPILASESFTLLAYKIAGCSAVSMIVPHVFTMGLRVLDGSSGINHKILIYIVRSFIPLGLNS